MVEASLPMPRARLADPVPAGRALELLMTGLPSLKRGDPETEAWPLSPQLAFLGPRPVLAWVSALMEAASVGLPWEGPPGSLPHLGLRVQGLPGQGRQPRPGRLCLVLADSWSRGLATPQGASPRAPGDEALLV